MLLYHNTSNENAIKINKVGIKAGLKINKYGKGNEAEGSGIWCSAIRDYGYGGATITIQINSNDKDLWKANDSEYIIYRDVDVKDIVDIDLLIANDIKCNPDRQDNINSTVESDISEALHYYTESELLNIFDENKEEFVYPYDINQLINLIKSKNKYCDKYKLNESIQEENKNNYIEQWKQYELNDLINKQDKFIKKYNKLYNKYDELYKSFISASDENKATLNKDLNRIKLELINYRDSNYYLFLNRFNSQFDKECKEKIDSHFSDMIYKVENVIGNINNIEPINSSNYHFYGSKGECDVKIDYIKDYKIERSHTRWLISNLTRYKIQEFKNMSLQDATIKALINQ